MPIPCNKTDRQLFSAATRITIENGQTTSFWTDRWLGGQAPCEIAPNIYKISSRKNQCVQDALANGKWMQDLRTRWTDNHLVQLIGLAELLDEVQLSSDPDSISWCVGKDDFYTAKYAYQLQFFGSVRTEFKQLIWKVWAPARCKFFIWTLMIGRVLTADKLLSRQWENDYFCPLCRRNLETAGHLFTECIYSIKIWTACAELLQLNLLQPITWANKEFTIRQWFSELICNRPKAIKKRAFTSAQLICWELWKKRNR
uniref:Uncharacterized protein n=1 Tax=Avena sativa TaxID=4498 RepID=A0ACD5YC02_AVESA